jgi:hypothetical protein
VGLRRSEWSDAECRPGSGHVSIGPLSLRNGAYSLLEHRDLLVGQGIGLGNDRNQVDFGVQAAHDFDVEGLEGVASGLDEVDTGVDAVVDDVHTVHLILCL